MYVFYPVFCQGCSSGVDVVGRMSTSWNIPLLTPVGIDSLFDNKTVFPTLTRLSFSFDGIGRFYLKLFEKFGWTDIALLTDYYVSTGAAMVGLQSDSLVRVFSKSELRTTLIVNHDLSLKAALTKATKVSRGDNFSLSFLVNMIWISLILSCP